MNYGYAQSVMDGSEQKFQVLKSMDIPESYSYVPYLPKVLNQGDQPICVPCSLSAFLNWNINVDTDGNNHRDNNIYLLDIFNSRTTSGNNSMSFKDALHYLRHNGVESDKGNLKIDSYAMVKSELPLKQALILNGPAVGGLPVWNESNYFWKKNAGDTFQGGHAISIVGYDKNGLIIRNSWGESFGKDGYIYLDWDDLKNFYEIWTMIA